MQLRQVTIDSTSINQENLATLAEVSPQLILVFASVEFFSDPSLFTALKQTFPLANLAGCSTAGEINRQGVMEHTAVITAIEFQSDTKVKVVDATISSMQGSQLCGKELGNLLLEDGLASVLLFGRGLDINGSALIEGVIDKIGHAIPISGGLGGDNAAFVKTYIMSNNGCASDAVVAVGLYGSSVEVGHGSFGGWSSFGPPRKVTRCDANILYELDDKPALQIYKDYLGDYAKDLPSSGLLFPFEMLTEDHNTMGLIRTILAVDEEQGSLVLAGDIDPNGFLRLMHAATDALIDGAEVAAKKTISHLSAVPENSLAILVSCVGRKLVMGDQVDDEVDSVAEILGDNAVLTGFYSYGEISPFSTTTDCKLHNQTMTITIISEN